MRNKKTMYILCISATFWVIIANTDFLNLRPLDHLFYICLFACICHCNNACLRYCATLWYFSHNLQGLGGDGSDNASDDESTSAPFSLVQLARHDWYTCFRSPPSLQLREECICGWEQEQPVTWCSQRRSLSVIIHGSGVGGSKWLPSKSGAVKWRRHYELRC